MNYTKKIILIGICLLTISFGYYFLYTRYNFSIDCIFHKITGLYCPGCGITRMFFSILELDFYQAFRYNPLIFILLIISLIYLATKVLSKKIFNRIIYISQTWTYILLGVIIIYGILRNIPIFDFLKPTIIS